MCFDAKCSSAEGKSPVTEGEHDFVILSFLVRTYISGGKISKLVLNFEIYF